MIVLASHSPVGLALGQLETNWGAHVAHLGISLFVGRFTRVAAAQQFDPTRAGISRCPSRFAQRAIAAMRDCQASDLAASMNARNFGAASVAR